MINEFLEHLFNFKSLSSFEWKVILGCMAVAFLLSFIFMACRYIKKAGFWTCLGFALLIAVLWFVIASAPITVFAGRTKAFAFVVGSFGGAWLLSMIAVVILSRTKRGIYACLIITLVIAILAIVLSLPTYIYYDDIVRIGYGSK